MKYRSLLNSAVLAVLVFTGGCAPNDAFRVGDVLIAKSDGTTLGRVIEVGPHQFPSGVTDQSALVQLDKDPQSKIWYSMEVLPGNYSVVGR